MKRILSIIALTVAVCCGAWAQTDRIAFGTMANGTVTTDNANPTGAATVTLTVTPATGYYITAQDITVTRTALGAHGRTRTPDIDETKYAVTAVSVDDTGKGTYSFNVEDGYGAYVEAAFTACAAITPVVSITGWTYGADAHSPSVTGNPGNGAVTYDYKVKGAADDTYQTTVPTEAGDYTVRATIAAAGHYLGNTATADFTIAKAALTNVMLVSDNLTYTGNELSVTVASVKAGTLDVPATAYTVSGDKGTVVGNYTVTVTAKDASNFSGTASASWSIVAEGAASFTVSGINPSYIYTGAEITPEPTVKNGTTTLTKGTDYTVGYSANKNVGTATVTITGIGGYSGTKNVNFNITPAALTVKADDKSVTYGDAVPEYSAAFSGFVGGETAAVLGGTLTFDCDYTPDSNVGTYTITPKGLTSNNYTITFTAATLTVNKADATLVAPTAKTGLEENGSEQELVNAGTATGGTLYYSLNGTDWQTAIPKGKDAKDYTVYYKVTGDQNHNDIAAKTLSVTIAKAAGPTPPPAPKDITATITGYDGTYDGKAHGINVTVTSPVDATVKYGISEDDYIYNDLSFADVGNYTIYYEITRDGYNTLTGSATVNIAKRVVTVSGITAHDKNYDGTTNATLVLGNAKFAGIIDGDNLTVTAKGTFEDPEVGNDKTVNISDLTLGGASVDNYMLAKTGHQTTTKASILAAGTIDRRHSGIEVRRNDTKALVDNEAFLTVMEDGSLRIDQVNILKPADAPAGIPEGVSVFIPARLTDYDGKTSGETYGVGNDIIITETTVPVTDIYLPETEEIINMAAHAFRLDPTESKTAFIHVSLPLLDDYALCVGLKTEYEAGKVMTTVTPTTQRWTLSSGVDIVVPEGLTANICMAMGNEEVGYASIKTTKAVVDGTERIIIKANNGVMMMGTANTSYDLRAWPCEERPSGMTPIPTDNAETYEGNELEPATITTHFEPTMYYILYNDTFYELESTDNTSVTPCKAVLRRTSATQASRLRLGQHTVGIGSLTLDSDADGERWYGLDGRKLDGKPTKKGVYIRNREKVIIK